MFGKHSVTCFGIGKCLCMTCAKDSDECCIRMNGNYGDCPIAECEEYKREEDDDHHE